jgi:hypothetical protein
LLLEAVRGEMKRRVVQSVETVDQKVGLTCTKVELEQINFTAIINCRLRPRNKFLRSRAMGLYLEEACIFER